MHLLPHVARMCYFAILFFSKTWRPYPGWVFFYTLPDVEHRKIHKISTCFFPWFLFTMLLFFFSNRKIVIKIGKKKKRKQESSEEESDEDPPLRHTSKDDDSVSTHLGELSLPRWLLELGQLEAFVKQRWLKRQRRAKPWLSSLMVGKNLETLNWF